MESLLRVLYVCLASGLLFATLGRGIPRSCCLRTDRTVLSLKNIKDYHMQNVALCPVDAVVFTTVKGIKVCSDPKKPWVKRAVKHFDSMKRQDSAVTTQAPSTNATEPARNGTAVP
ncbi:hypothetical protein ACEWY4_019036 [Coilia grayii]|uniref:C-C motif chemokine n=1 Tax=Coilia grayii TaxID=363190 RepID=A0ABD1JHW1_9TELE